MFDALDELFEMMEIYFDHKNEFEKIPSTIIQEKYLNILKEIA